MNFYINLFALLTLLVTIVLILLLVIKLVFYLFRRKKFPKKLIFSTAIGALVFFGLYVYSVYFYTFDTINREHMQEGPGPVVSPTEKYIASAFYEPYGGAPGGVNVWVEVTDIEKQEAKVIYYADANTDFRLEWLDEKSLLITNNEPEFEDTSITLNVDSEIYHEGGLACASWLMKNQYEKCYHD